MTDDLLLWICIGAIGGHMLGLIVIVLFQIGRDR